jgi:hypothetical protein
MLDGFLAVALILQLVRALNLDIPLVKLSLQIRSQAILMEHTPALLEDRHFRVFTAVEHLVKAYLARIIDLVLLEASAVLLFHLAHQLAGYFSIALGLVFLPLNSCNFLVMMLLL